MRYMQWTDHLAVAFIEIHDYCFDIIKNNSSDLPGHVRRSVVISVLRKACHGMSHAQTAQNRAHNV